jgi:hypothetical protein
MFTKVLSINDTAIFFLGMLGNKEARLPSENNRGEKRKKEKALGPNKVAHYICL